MAIPTITSVSPTTVFTGGMLVTITGSNFRTAYPLPNIDGELPVPPPTVEVSFDGVPGDAALVFSANTLTVIAAPHNPGAATITVKNLDVDGNPIAGEVVSSVAALTYARADLSITADFTRLNRALLSLLKQQIIANVTMSTSVDYSDQEGLALKVVAVAKLPCVTVSPPSLKLRYGEYAQGSERPEVNTGVDFVRRSTFRTVDITWQIRVFDDNQVRALNLVTLIQQVLKDNTFLSMDRDPDDLSKGKVDYEFYPTGEFNFSDSPNNSDVRVAAGSVTAYGFWFEDIAGFPESSVVETGQQTEAIVIDLGPR